ncbi:unnamed protein product, partial [Dovyalis caffra]
MVTVLEHCKVSPPPGTTSEKTLPLTFFDLRLVRFPPMKNIFFYEYANISKSHFMESIIPNLIHSLSLALKYVPPFAGNLIFPPNSGRPQIHYLEGDSVSMTIAECSGDFNHLTGRKMIDAIEYHSLFPQLPPGFMSHDTLIVPISAFQVTLFPNSGICMGFNIHHTVADGQATAVFMRIWAAISKGGDEACVGRELEPSLDRTRLRDPKGLEVETAMWNYLKKTKYDGLQPPLPTNKVRATFVINQATVQQLKKVVLARYPSLSRVTTVTVICAYVWSCMAKARAASGERKAAEDDDEIVHFLTEVDCRPRLDPPLPANYVGNCLAPALASVKMSQLKGSDGFVIAAKIIRDSIHKRLHDAGGVLKGAENWAQEMDAAYKTWVFESFSSPKFSIYSIDFGWGRPKSNEDICADEFEAFVITDGQNEGEIEVFLSYPRPIMDAFTSIFSSGLQTLDDEVKKLGANHSIRTAYDQTQRIVALAKAGSMSI